MEIRRLILVEFGIAKSKGGNMKYMPIEEFKERGYLQEANRLFFHPRGLALAVSRNDEDESMELCGIQDCRDDPEGLVFDDFDEEKAGIIYDEAIDRRKARSKLACCTTLGIQVEDYDETTCYVPTLDELRDGYSG